MASFTNLILGMACVYPFFAEKCYRSNAAVLSLDSDAYPPCNDLWIGLRIPLASAFPYLFSLFAYIQSWF